MKSKLIGLAALACAMICCIARAEEVKKVDNPEYKHWAKFKVGSSNTSKGDMSMGPQQMSIESTTTLKELTKEYAVIESNTKMDMGGEKHPGRAHTRKIFAEVSSDEKKPAVAKVGKETVEAMGKKIDCTVWEMHILEDRAPTDIKIWANDDVPGAVKMEFHVKAPNMEMKRSMTVQSVVVKK